jgi:hypothetical protein
MTATETKGQELERAADTLRDILTKCEHQVYSQLIQVAPRSGNRLYQFYLVRGMNDVRWISYNVASLTGYTWDDGREGVKVAGSGFDGGSAVVESLSFKLYGHGSKLTHRKL